jgi:hypothetical protein
MSANPTLLVREALAGTGIELIASCTIAAYDARAPDALRSGSWLPNAQGMVVAASAGPALWRAFRGRRSEEPTLMSHEHPYDDFVSEQLARADEALAGAGVSFRRFEAAFHAAVALDFIALAELVGFGSPSPFGLAIHPEHGAWWALRGAWMVDAAPEPAAVLCRPCAGCAAPCVGGWPHARGIVQATAETRGRCVVGQASRYDDEQIAYHYGRTRPPSRSPRRDR